MTEIEYEKQLGLKDMELKRKEVQIAELKEENTELKAKRAKIRDYLAYKIPHELMNEATNKIWRMI